MKSIFAACVVALSLTPQTPAKPLGDSILALATVNGFESVIGHAGTVAEFGSRVPRSPFAPVFVFLFLLSLSFIVSFVLYRLFIGVGSSETE